ncbi:hypothetical protein SUGI_0566940 [Cryptomeria japonica]|uniref:protein CNGC15b n=1 Tax=Cryptomeria japonica TaxID=3369 RepID=UPI002408B486|nr:protein CNGC15b [Cryptomeria japonica]GLJ28760.1 hypothetical protein SUGI_0566940 [Cryptomeria japonica]
MEFMNNSVRVDQDLDNQKFTSRKKHELTKTRSHDLCRHWHCGKFKVFVEDSEPLRRRILDPRNNLFQLWNRIFFISSLVSLFLDPLYLFLPMLDGSNSCMRIDRRLQIIVTIFRSIIDLFYILNMIMKFQTAYIAPTSLVLGSGELVVDPEQIAKRYLKTSFFLELVASLPIPQLAVWFLIPSLRRSNADRTKTDLLLIALFQYFLRMYLIFPLASEIARANGAVIEKSWLGAAYNLFLYMMACHTIGATWYLLAIERGNTCWQIACRNDIASNCQLDFLDCDSLTNGLSSVREQWMNITPVFSNCNATNLTNSFSFGIYGIAWTTQITSSNFLDKYTYTVWWGLMNLSSLGQNLATSTFGGENIFSIIVGTLGLILFARVLANLQTLLQSLKVRVEECRVQRGDTEEFMEYRQLPQDLRERVRRYDEYKWVATRGVDEETIMQSLPMDLRRDIKRHLCLNIVLQVPFFAQMDDQLIDAIIEGLTPALSTEGTYIVREGDPVNEMFFIIRGYLESATTDGGRAGFFNSITLGPGDFCGEELLNWALFTKPTLNLPSSTRTVKALVEVEAFALRAEDLSFVANQFRRLHSKKLKHTFRFHSNQWRKWSACFIQAAWRRYKRRKLTAELFEKERFSSSQNQEFESCRSFATSVGFESFRSFGNHAELMAEAAQNNPNIRRGIQISHDSDDELPKLQKPEEPDFSVEVEDE